MKNIHPYVAIARPDHWFKNIFILPGVAFAAVLKPEAIFNSEVSLSSFIFRLVIGIISTCLIASANYVINEWLDAEFDKFHPVKKNRPAVQGKLKASIVYTEYALLLLVGLSLASLVSPYFLAVAAALMIQGIFYNIRPMRTKEKAYLDVISEAINNPIRLMLGWFIVTSTPLPPSSLLFAYWMGGAFLMAIKRYGEYRFIANPEQAGLYRRSFKVYTENSLLISSFFYANCAAFFLGVFLVKYRIELLLTLPFLAFLFTWYLYIGLKKDSPAQHPERLLRDKRLTAYLLFLGVLFMTLFFAKIDSLHWFLENSFITQK